MPTDEQRTTAVPVGTGGMVLRRQFILASLAIIGAPFPAMRAVGQTQKYPEKPIRLIVPFAPGGGVDAFARLLGVKLKQLNGYTIVVDNRSGANGAIGGLAVRDAKPDGYTLLFSAGTHVMARHVMQNAPYDPITDFTPIARAGEAPMLFVMSPNMSPRNLTELIAEARKQPDSWKFATSALGAPGHLATVAFNQLAGLDLPILSYRGTAPALNDVAGGHVRLMIDPIAALLPMAKGNKVKGLAVTSAKRTAIAPDYPTAAESGLPGLEYTSWYGVWGPKGLPADLVASLNKTINTAVQELDKEGQLAKLGFEAISETPTQFEEFTRSYVERNAELLKTAKFERI
jgi:tripartite-type tricarboxylate transporter receptor subunit TctC